ncbi:MAG: hypothetical protein ACLVJ6_06840 [Merdibacter sp.]
MRREGAPPLRGTADRSVTERLEYELNIITKMGYVDYYLIVSDLSITQIVGIRMDLGAAPAQKPCGVLYRHHRHRSSALQPLFERF